MKINTSGFYIYILKLSYRMILQRRLYGIKTVCFLVFIILCNRQLFFFPLTLNKPLKDCIQGKLLNLTLKSSDIKSFRSSLQSHPLRIILDIISFFIHLQIVCYLLSHLTSAVVYWRPQDKIIKEGFLEFFWVKTEYSAKLFSAVFSWCTEKFRRKRHW